VSALRKNLVKFHEYKANPKLAEEEYLQKAVWEKRPSKYSKVSSRYLSVNQDSSSPKNGQASDRSYLPISNRSSPRPTSDKSRAGHLAGSLRGSRTPQLDFVKAFPTLNVPFLFAEQTFRSKSGESNASPRSKLLSPSR